MVTTYVVLVLFFAYVFQGNASLPSYLQAFWISLKNMAGVVRSSSAAYPRW